MSLVTPVKACFGLTSELVIVKCLLIVLVKAKTTTDYMISSQKMMCYMNSNMGLDLK